MTNDQILEMAKHNIYHAGYFLHPEDLITFARLIAEKQMEQDIAAVYGKLSGKTGRILEAAIRNSGGEA
jgi:hypothetical protein